MSNFFIHAPAMDGGLGIPQLRYVIPLMRKDRFEKLLASDDPAVASFAESPMVTKVLSRYSVPAQVCNVPICNKDNLKRALARGLHCSVDGRGLAASNQVPKINNWILNPIPTMSSANYIGAIKIREHLLSTSVRQARGRPQRSVACDACGRPESLGHILQVCPRTHNARIDRHNSVLSRCVKMLIKKKWSVVVEPAIPTPAGIRRPDIVAWRADAACYVIDVTVAADNADLQNVHALKVEHYDTQHVRDWAARVSGMKDVFVSSVSFNWRGALSLTSYNLLKFDLLLEERDIGLLAAIVLERGYMTYLQFAKSTYRVPGR